MTYHQMIELILDYENYYDSYERDRRREELRFLSNRDLEIHIRAIMVQNEGLHLQHY